jgi:uncharacterized protein YraI
MKVAYILGLALACIAVPVLAKPAYVASTVNLRAAPGTGSEILAKIPGGSLVDARACSEGWCEITWQDKTGYAIQTALDLSGRVPQQRVAGPAYRQTPPANRQRPEAIEDPDYVDRPLYYEQRPPVYYGPYYRPHWGWRRYWW